MVLCNSIRTVEVLTSLVSAAACDQISSVLLNDLTQS